MVNLLRLVREFVEDETRRAEFRADPSVIIAETDGDLSGEDVEAALDVVRTQVAPALADRLRPDDGDPRFPRLTPADNEVPLTVALRCLRWIDRRLGHDADPSDTEFETLLLDLTGVEPPPPPPRPAPAATDAPVDPAPDHEDAPGDHRSAEVIPLLAIDDETADHDVDSGDGTAGDEKGVDDPHDDDPGPSEPTGDADDVADPIDDGAGPHDPTGDADDVADPIEASAVAPADDVVERFADAPEPVGPEAAIDDVSVLRATGFDEYDDAPDAPASGLADPERHADAAPDPDDTPSGRSLFGGGAAMKLPFAGDVGPMDLPFAGDAAATMSSVGGGPGDLPFAADDEPADLPFAADDDLGDDDSPEAQGEPAPAESEPVADPPLFRALEVVILPLGIPEVDVPAGAEATVVAVHTEPSLHYEIEVDDGEGTPTFLGTVTPETLAKLPR